MLLNQRNCGGTEHLTPGLYHSGLTADPRAVIRELARVDGLSARRRRRLLARRQPHDEARRRARRPSGRSRCRPSSRSVRRSISNGACARSSGASTIPYQWNFVRNLRARMRRKAAAWPAAFDLTPLDSIWTIRAFDDVYTAPSHGFGDAIELLPARECDPRGRSQIRIPTLILAAADDPFVPVRAVPRRRPSATIRTSPCASSRTAATAGSSARRTAATTATGRRSTAVAFLCTRHANAEAARLQDLDERARELRPLPFVLVLEDTRTRRPSRRRAATASRPSLEIGGRVALVAQAEVAVAGRRARRASSCRRSPRCRARRCVPRARDRRRRSARSRDGTRTPRGCPSAATRETSRAAARSHLKVRRQLKQQRAKMRAEHARASQKNCSVVRAVLQPLDRA